MIETIEFEELITGMFLISVEDDLYESPLACAVSAVYENTFVVVDLIHNGQVHLEKERSKGFRLPLNLADLEQLIGSEKAKIIGEGVCEVNHILKFLTR